MRLAALSVCSVLAALAFGGCTIDINSNTASNDAGPGADTGAPPGDGDPIGATPTSLKILSVKAGGDMKMSGRLGLDAGKLRVTVAAIRDPDAPTKPADPSKVTFALNAGETALTCSVGKASSSARAAVDLVFINDTTGSMSGTVQGISSSVGKFADDVAAGGVDARFSMYTYGDAFATVPAAENPFKVGKGDFAPPELDTDARPYVGLTDVATFKSFLAELEPAGVLGVGGGDSEENTLGALAYANTKLSFRDGAARMFIAIGDNPSHQKGSADETFAGTPFAPPSGAELVAALDGSAVVHVVGHDQGESPFYNLKMLADQTGGAFLELPSDGVVDLGALDLQGWLTASFAGSCEDPRIGKYQIVVRATVNGSKAFVGTLTFDVELS